MLANRVKKRFKHLSKRFSRQQIDVFRLYDWDIPEIRAVVDWYGGHLVIGEYMRRQSVPEWLLLMGRAVADTLNVPAERLHLKQRWAGRQEGKRYERIDYTDKKIVLHERDFKFLVNPYDYVDTGLFSDHRDTRQMVRQMAAGKDFLNLYCYTASFSCYAAKGGARSTVSVDRSESVIQWAGENLKLNEIDPKNNRLVHAHTFDYLKKAHREGKQFDLAVVDPPSYSTTKVRNESFDIARDHPRLLSAVIDLMRPKATLFFSTNHQDFTLCMDRIKAAAVEEITAQTIPEDYRNKRKTIHRCWRITV
ncbi:class I SAM-dependent methyltransferase [Desulfosarcina ovata]|uniref:Ribosomal RNA large subunit methyltransferase K n=1 Tax=Desulfosarcina ovata subsp. ovata TaxID=2752305 RepID=A0A5K8ADR2_9BACT|nr:class I SAM-dependent methyltransferase [Desulfosarcina ovata]BBO90134.1 ribosomal RNA large subunit methyltransferase K [Desulfosarcina ovata subsp. ovata]